MSRATAQDPGEASGPAPDRCRPALQIAWDLVQDRHLPDALSTVQISVSLWLAWTLAERLEPLQREEHSLIAAIADRIAAAPDPDAALAAVGEVLDGGR